MDLSQTPIAELKNHVGQEIGVSDWFDITLERVDNFGESIEDRQWLHCDRPVLPTRWCSSSPDSADRRCHFCI